MQKEKKTPQLTKTEANTLWFSDISITDVPLVGGKNASLGEMYRNLTEKGVSVPNGFAVTAHAYREFLASNNLEKQMKALLKDLDVKNMLQLKKVGKAVRALVLKGVFSKTLEKEIIEQYKKLGGKTKNLAVAVRSSATAEDLPDASFAGQQETYLNVRGEKELLKAVKQCMASLFTDRAISYREAKGFDHLSVSLSVTIQEMVGSDTGASGVMFTMDTESGFPGVVLVTAAYGLGEYVVQGRVVPDQYYVFKEGIVQGKQAIIGRQLGTKEVKLVYGKTSGTKQQNVSNKDRDRFVLTDAEVARLAKWGMEIEAYYKKPQDIEWAKDGKTGKLYIVQARPETVKTHHNTSIIEEFILKKKGKELLRGTAVGQKIGAGKARVIETREQMKQFKAGEVLVTRITDPDWEPIMRMASAIVTEQGGKTSHAAIVARELGIPAVVGVKNARKELKTGRSVTVSAAEGEAGIIYAGVLPFEVRRIELDHIPKTKTKIMVNVGDPDHAFSLSFLPQDGVGLAREEFIFTNFIRIHPLALLHFDTLHDKAAKQKIAAMTRGYAKKSDYCVDRLAEGIGRIAAAFYPNDVIIRFSDFKTNEYVSLIGGKQFEPKEENPMIGWRGASRYVSKEYKEAFRLECDAVKRVRDAWGLTNVIPMVPFCRTPEEGERVIRTMEEFGLTRGENGLQVYVMCEIPSNVVLAEEFAALFDGFSIGSNDLTQLTLGVDRDSSTLSEAYNENNDAVKTLIRQVIAVAKKHKKKIGICGQAPSDYPEFAEFLVREGIDSISLNPDSLIPIRERVAQVEKTVGKTGNKTNGKLLGLVAAIGLVAAGFIGLGAGCIGTQAGSQPIEQSWNDVSPAMIRERSQQKIAEQKDQEFAGQLSTVSVSDFTTFSLQHPATWSVSHWKGGITLNDGEGKYVSAFRQLLSHPKEGVAIEPITLAGKTGITYATTLQNGTPVVVVEIPLETGEILEINSTSDMLDQLLQTWKFTTSTDPEADGFINAWDVKEKRFCAAMITYARQGEGQCVAFPTPCDVPDGWGVCEP